MKQHSNVLHINSGVDYRLRLLQQAGTYLSPHDESAARKLQHYFDESASSQVRSNHALNVNGRDIQARACAKGIVWFDFEQICDGPRSQNDYIEIARIYHAVLISGVPALGANTDDQARRFINLVDEFYDRSVKLVLAAESPLLELYSGGRLEFEFQRTLSRLQEMQSHEYLAREHKP